MNKKKCENCKPRKNAVIKITEDGKCIDCGKQVGFTQEQMKSVTISLHTLKEEIENIISEHQLERIAYDEAVTKLLSLIKTVGEKAIKTDIVMFEHHRPIIYHRTREELRSQQRKALEDIISGREEFK